MKTKNFKYSFDTLYSDENELQSFKEKLRKYSNIVYFFCKDEECLYVGESGKTLYDRCFVNTDHKKEKHKDKEWFKESNRIFIIQLDDTVDKYVRKLIERAFIVALKPKGNKQ